MRLVVGVERSRSQQNRLAPNPQVVVEHQEGYLSGKGHLWIVRSPSPTLGSPGLGPMSGRGALI